MMLLRVFCSYTFLMITSNETRPPTEPTRDLSPCVFMVLYANIEIVTLENIINIRRSRSRYTHTHVLRFSDVSKLASLFLGKQQIYENEKKTANICH